MIATLYRFTNDEYNRLTENKLTQELNPSIFFFAGKKLGNARWTIKDKTELTFGTPRNLRN